MSDELKPQSIGSDEFTRLVNVYFDLCTTDKFDVHIAHIAWKNLIAHIDAWGARLAEVPAGYKLVPILSTDLMDIAGREMLRDCGHERPTKRDAELCWSAMIEAAPKPEDA
jgi:hypothetical protein